MINKEWELTKFLPFAAILILFVNILFISELPLITKAFKGSSLSFSDPMSVKITYPEKEHKVNIGSNLEIIGTSGYDSDLTCNVSVIINDIKPYQAVTPTGTNTKNDYTTWKYDVNPGYTTISRGDNKITSRLLCSNDQGEDLRKWYSINVVGQNETKISHQSLSTATLAIPITTETDSTATSTIINLDRDVFIELINNRIENNTEVIKDTIEDSIISLYTRMT